MTQLTGVIDTACTLGEGPVWDERLGRLWWTDIQEARLHRWDWDEREVISIELPERLGSLGLTSDPGRLVCAFVTGFALLQPETGRVEWLEKTAPVDRGIRMNDGRIDRQGRFWAGSMVEDASLAGGERGALYRLDPGGAVSRHLDGIGISNSICFSPEGDRLYFADTPTGRIERFTLTEAGTLDGRSRFAEVGGGGGPDGSDVDAEGFVWNAEWGNARLTRYSPDGLIERQVPLPVSQPTCMAFGGPDLAHIFVTTAREDLDTDVLAGQPEAGKVLILNTGCSGLAASKFPLDPADRRQ